MVVCYNRSDSSTLFQSSNRVDSGALSFLLMQETEVDDASCWYL